VSWRRKGSAALRPTGCDDHVPKLFSQRQCLP
jgi:hypothetical protein